MLFLMGLMAIINVLTKKILKISILYFHVDFLVNENETNNNHNETSNNNLNLQPIAAALNDGTSLFLLILYK